MSENAEPSLLEKAAHNILLIFCGFLIMVSTFLIYVTFKGFVYSYFKNDETLESSNSWPFEEANQIDGRKGKVKPLPDYMIDNIKPDELDQLKKLN